MQILRNRLILMNKWFAGCDNVKLFELHKKHACYQFSLCSVCFCTMRAQYKHACIFIPTLMDHPGFNHSYYFITLLNVPPELSLCWQGMGDHGHQYLHLSRWYTPVQAMNTKLGSEDMQLLSEKPRASYSTINLPSYIQHIQNVP